MGGLFRVRPVALATRSQLLSTWSKFRCGWARERVGSFHRLGPVLARRLLLTGDIIEADAIEHLGIFTETCDPGQAAARARYWAEKAAKMPADGVVIAKEAFRLVEQSQAYQGEEVASYLFHAFGTNLQFAPGEFNFVKTRAQHGTKEAFRLRDEHFYVPEPPQDPPKSDAL